jgi:hypothetical protein
MHQKSKSNAGIGKKKDNKNINLSDKYLSNYLNSKDKVYIFQYNFL